MTANCTQVSVSAPGPMSRKTSYNTKQGLDGSNHSLTKKKSKRKSTTTESLKQQPTAAIPFPWKLHRILDDADAKGFNDIISWVPSENGFKVHKTKQFDDDIMPKYFDKTKYKSFQRQLNMWGFDRVGSGPYKGAYLHPCFIRGQPQLCESMQRTKIKGIHSKKLRKNSVNGDLLGGGSNHSLHSLSSNHSLSSYGGSSHSLRSLGSSHSVITPSSVHNVRASIEAAAQKVADLERQKEEIQRKLELVSSKANAAAAGDALANMTSSCNAGRMITPHDSMHSRGNLSISDIEIPEPLDDNDDCFAPLPLNEGDELLFGGRNFFFAEDGQTTDRPSLQQRQRPGRRYSLVPKGGNSEEYILKDLDAPDFFGEDQGSAMNCTLSPTPLAPNMNVIKARAMNITGNVDASLLIGFDKPSRRFSFLSTPVQNPFEQMKPMSRSSRTISNGNRSMEDINNNMMKMNMNNTMNNNMMRNMMIQNMMRTELDTSHHRTSYNR